MREAPRVLTRARFVRILRSGNGKETDKPAPLDQAPPARSASGSGGFPPVRFWTAIASSGHSRGDRSRPAADPRNVRFLADGGYRRTTGLGGRLPTRFELSGCETSLASPHRVDSAVERPAVNFPVRPETFLGMPPYRSAYAQPGRGARSCLSVRPLAFKRHRNLIFIRKIRNLWVGRSLHSLCERGFLPRTGEIE
jgi:hypothetical protein